MSNTRTIETLLLGAILAHPDNYWAVEVFLDEDCFTDEGNSRVYRTIRERALNGKAITRNLVEAALPSEIGGVEAGALLSSMVYAANKEDFIPVEEFAHTLRDAALRRQIKELANGVLKAASDENANPQQIIDRMSERVGQLSRASDIENESTLESSMKQVAARAKITEGRGVAVKPCLYGIEELIGYFPPSSLTLIGAGPGGGKTALAMQQLIETSKTLPVTLFELEMDNASLVARSLRRHIGMSAKDIMMGVSDEGVKLLSDVAAQLHNYKMRLVAPPKMTIHQLRSRAFAHKHKYGLNMIVVDHLKLIQRPSKYRMDPVERAYENAGDLKILSKELDVPVIALCQFTKSGRTKETPEPEMEDFYGGSLEEHADIMLAMVNRYDWLEKNPPKSNGGAAKEKWETDRRKSQNRIEIYKLKNRYGSGRGKKVLHWDGANTQFSDLDPGPQADLLGATA